MQRKDTGMRLKVIRGTVVTGKARVGQLPTRVNNGPGTVIEVNDEEGIRIARLGVAEPVDGSIIPPEPEPPAPRARQPGVWTPGRPSRVRNADSDTEPLDAA